MSEANEPVPEPKGLLAVFDELLKQPLAGFARARVGGTLRTAQALLIGAVGCFVLYGAAAGFFQGGLQVFFSALKAPVIVILSLALCLPSLYILAALMGASITARALLVVVAGFLGTLGIFMAGLLPIAWLFSVTSRSLAFMVWLHLALWLVTVVLAGRFLQLVLRESGGRSIIAPWVLLFVIVSFQAATLLRPVLWQPEAAPRFPGMQEKLSFLDHFMRSMSPPTEAADEGIPTAALDSLLESGRALGRAQASKGMRAAMLDFYAEDSIGFTPGLGAAKAQLRAMPDRAVKMEWEPRTGDLSRRGDFAWLAGPYSLAARGGGSEQGTAFSIWKRQEDGSWRILMALQVPTSEAPAFARPGFQLASETMGRFVQLEPNEDVRAGLLEADRVFAGRSSQDAREMLRTRLRDDALLIRTGAGGIAGKPAIDARLGPTGESVVYQPIDAIGAGSGDIGVTYGRYHPAPDAPETLREAGYYVRVWKRWPSGYWAIAADVQQPQPADVSR